MSALRNRSRVTRKRGQTSKGRTDSVPPQIYRTENSYNGFASGKVLSNKFENKKGTNHSPTDGTKTFASKGQ